MICCRDFELSYSAFSPYALLRFEDVPCCCGSCICSNFGLYVQYIRVCTEYSTTSWDALIACRFERWADLMCRHSSSILAMWRVMFTIRWICTVYSARLRSGVEYILAASTRTLENPPTLRVMLKEQCVCTVLIMKFFMIWASLFPRSLRAGQQFFDYCTPSSDV